MQSMETHACFECRARCSANIFLWTSVVGLFFFLTFCSCDQCCKHRCEVRTQQQKEFRLCGQRANAKMFSFDVAHFNFDFDCYLYYKHTPVTIEILSLLKSLQKNKNLTTIILKISSYLFLPIFFHCSS